MSKQRNIGKALAQTENGLHHVKSEIGRIRTGSHEEWLYKKLANSDMLKWLWYTGVLHPFFKKIFPIPPLFSRGLYPTTPWKAPIHDLLPVNASGFGFACLEPDGWYGEKFLENGAGGGAPAFRTTSAYVGTTSPAKGVTTQVNALSLPTISNDFSSGSEDGTKYTNVSSGLRLSALTTSNDVFKGQVYAVRTIDPHEFPLTGKSCSDLLTAAAEEGSYYELYIYDLTADGGFILEKYFVRGIEYTAEDVQAPASFAPAAVVGKGVRTLTLVNLPLTPEAYDDQIINGSVTSTLQQPTLGFFLNEVKPYSGVSFSISAVMNYTTQKIPSYRAENRGNSDNMTITHGLDDLVGAMSNAASLGLGTPHMNTLNRPHSMGFGGWLHDGLKKHGGDLLKMGGAALKPWLGKQAGKFMKWLKQQITGDVMSFDEVAEMIPGAIAGGGSGFIDGASMTVNAAGEAVPIIEVIAEGAEAVAPLAMIAL